MMMMRMMIIGILILVSSCNPYYKCVVIEKETDGLYIECLVLNDGLHYVVPKQSWATADQIWKHDTIYVHQKTMEIRINKDQTIYKK